MIRWTYLIPRLIILSLIVLALWIGKDPLIQFIVVKHIQSATGAKVEIGQLRTSLENQKIFLKDVAIANPSDSMSNIVQAEMAYVEFNPGQLLSRRFVIEHAQASQIMFNSPRTVSGALDEAAFESPSTKPIWQPKQLSPIELLGRDWVDQLQPLPDDSTGPNDFELVQTVRELKPFWDQKLPAITNQIKTLHAKWVNLKRTAEADLRNPLRATLKNADHDLALLREESLTIENQIASLSEIITAHRDRLNEAYNRDIAKLHQQTSATFFDADQISKLLLTRLEEQYVGEILGWFHWFRSASPDPAIDFQNEDTRGTNVDLAGVTTKPGFLIKRIDLEGEGRFANQYFSFAGSAHDLTLQPSRHDQPATFELRAQGNQHVIISCTMDRRHDHPIDKLRIICPDLELEGQTLGEENSVLVTLGPASRIQAEIEIQTDGDQLSGVLVFRHSNVSLHVDRIHEMAGGKDTALHLNQGLVSVDHFETRVNLSGTIDDYAFEFVSDLGDRFAKSANSMLAEKNHLKIERIKSELQELKAAQIGALDNQITNQIRQLRQLLSNESAHIASIRDIIPDSNRRPRIFK